MLQWAHTKTGLDTETLTNAGEVVAEAGWWPRRGNISSATVADGKTSRTSSRKWWKKRMGGENADADTCRSLSCTQWRSAIKQ